MASTEDEAVLVLNHFQRPVFIDFGEAPLGFRVSRRLRLCTKELARVTVEKCPRSFTVEPSCVDVESESFVEIVWTVTGGVRDVLQLKLNGRFRLQVTLLGRCGGPRRQAPSRLRGRESSSSSSRAQIVAKKSKSSSALCIVKKKELTMQEPVLREWIGDVLRLRSGTSSLATHAALRAAYDRLGETRTRIDEEIRCGRLQMRNDRDTNDVGLRSKIVDLLTSTYASPWLRLCARQLYRGAKTPKSTKQLLFRLMFGEVRVAGGREGGAFGLKTKQRSKSRLVSQFLALVHLLDEARATNIMPQRPQLLMIKDGAKKALREFAACCLAREGDVLVHLARHGLVLKYQQSPLDEVDWRIRDDVALRSQLRDGINLGRAVDRLIGEPVVSKFLRAPATSRLHKIHNVEAVLSELHGHGLNFPQETCRAIVDAKKDEVLVVLQEVYFKFGGYTFSSVAIVNGEIDRLALTASWIPHVPGESAINILTNAKAAAAKVAAMPRREESADDTVELWRSALNIAAGVVDVFAFYRPPELSSDDPLLSFVDDHLDDDGNEDFSTKNVSVASRLIQLAHLRRTVLYAQRLWRNARYRRRTRAAIAVQAAARRFLDRNRLWCHAAAVHIQTVWRLRRHLFQNDEDEMPTHMYSARRSKRDMASFYVCALDAKLLWSTAAVSVLLKSLAKRFLHPKLLIATSVYDEDVQPCALVDLLPHIAKLPVVIVQAAIRRFQAEILKEKLLYAVVVLQNSERARQARLYSRRLRCALPIIALSLQSHARRQQAMSSLAAALHLQDYKLRCAVNIQKLARRRRARTTLRRQQSQIAIWFQRHARARKTRQIRRAFKDAALRLQSQWRRRQATVCVCARRRALVSSALFFQRLTRRWCAVKRTRLRCQLLRTIAIYVQTRTRRLQAIAYAGKFRRASTAIAIWVQCRVRSRRGAREAIAHFGALSTIALGVQAHARRRQARIYVQKCRGKLSACVLLQRQVRRVHAIRQAKLNRSAYATISLRLQSLARRRLATTHVAILRSTALSLALLLQSRLRMVRAAREASKLRQAFTFSALRIQSHVRSRQASVVLSTKTRIALWCQCRVRSRQAAFQTQALREASLTRTRCISARAIAITLQSHARRRRAIRSFRRARHERMAIVKFQSLWRRHQAKQLLAKKFNALMTIALWVQHQFRLRASRVAKVLEQRLRAANFLQTQERRRQALRRREHMIRESALILEVQRMSSIVRIQSTARRLLALSASQQRRGQQIRSATTIQSIVRGSSARQEFCLISSACKRIQRRQRRHSADRADRFLQDLLEDSRVNAIVILQRWWRDRVYQRTAIVPVNKKAALLAQCAWRRHRACWDFYLRLGAIVTIQRRVRCARLWRSTQVALAPRMLPLASVVTKRKHEEEGDGAAKNLRRVAREWVHEVRIERARATLSRALKCSTIARTVRRRRFFSATRVIQAFARSLAVRRAQTQDVASKRLRLIALAARARSQPELILGNRTRAALAVLRNSTKLTEIMKACSELEVSTRLSVSCCEQFVDARATLVLYRLMRTCNRSKPHLDLLTTALRVLVNITAHDQLIPRVCPSSNHVEILLNLVVQVLREKEEPFHLALRVLRRVCGQVSRFRTQCNSPDNVKRLASAAHLLKLKNRKAQSSAINSFTRTNALGCASTNVSRG